MTIKDLPPEQCPVVYFCHFLRRGSPDQPTTTDRAGEKTSLPLACLCPELDTIGQLVPVHSPPSPSSSPFPSPELSSAATATTTLESGNDGGHCSFEPDGCAISEALRTLGRLVRPFLPFLCRTRVRAPRRFVLQSAYFA